MHVDEVHSAIAGDRAAFARLVAAHQAMVSGIALAILGERRASEDVAQEAFAAAWRQRAHLRHPERVAAWLRQITRFRARQHLRDAGRRARWVTADAEAVARAVDPGPSAAEQLTEAEADRALQGALAGLDEDARTVLVLYYRSGEKVADVARTLGVAEAAVRKRLSRARQRLRDGVERRLAVVLVAFGPGPDLLAQLRPTLDADPVRPLSARFAPAAVGLLIAAAVAPLGASMHGTTAAVPPPVIDGAVVRAPPAREVRSAAVVLPEPVRGEVALRFPDLDPHTQLVLTSVESAVGLGLFEGCGEPWAQQVGAAVSVTVTVSIRADGVSAVGIEAPVPPPAEIARCLEEAVRIAPWPPLTGPGTFTVSLPVHATPPADPVSPETARARLDQALESAESVMDALTLHRDAIVDAREAELPIHIEIDGADVSMATGDADE
jgi:RNA polymerase sigma factor (sigma-70 family)